MCMKWLQKYLGVEKPENNSIGNKDWNEKSGAEWWYGKYFRNI